MFSNWAHRFDNAANSLRAIGGLAEQGSLTISPHSKQWLEGVGRQVLQISIDLGLQAAETRTRLFLGDVNGLVQRGDQTGIARAMEEIERLFRQDMMQVCFESIPLNRTDYYNAGFGSEVEAAFPSAMQDIREGNTCFALGRFTACVFHMMRVAEIALRVLAIDRGVSFPEKELEAAQWGQIIGQLESKIKNLRQASAGSWSSTSVRDAQIAFYHEAEMEFRAFNEVWRRHVSHAHPGAFCDEGTAMSAREHTENLVRLLATKMSEAQQTPEFWTS